MKKQTSCLARNLSVLRQLHKLSQEEVAEAVGVSRQAVAKWESGESAPDIVNCDALAQLYQVSLDNLIHYDDRRTSMSIPPKGKHMFGAVKVGERGQIVLPKRAREVSHIQPGDIMVVLGDENPEMAGIALVKGETILQSTDLLRRALRAADEEDAP